MIRAATSGARRSFPFLVAAGAWAGASLPLAAPMWSAVVVLVGSMLSRRRYLVLPCVAIASAVLAANAMAGLSSLPPGAWSGTATLAGDPVERAGGSSVDVVTDDGRMELTAWGAAGRMLAERAAGDRVRVEGTVSALSDPERSAWRHVRSRLRATKILRSGTTAWWMVVPNQLRAVVLDGAAPLPAIQRPVYAGFVLGDDHGRSEEVTAWFEAAGLLHLLVVSGENVAFILIVTGPILARVPGRTRFVLTAIVLLVFAAVTRFEPSVLRATTMAAVAAGSVLGGRATSGRRTLAIAVAILVLVDPLLVRSVGFRLSVAASAGIVLLAPAIENRLRGPARLRTLLAVTIAAQLSVAPIIVPMFGAMPLVAVPANVLAEPVAGVVMMWGSTAGVLAGLAGGPVAAVLQLPTRVALAWIIAVARVADALPDVDVGLPAVVAIVTALVVSAVVRGRRRRGAAPTTVA